MQTEASAAATADPSITPTGFREPMDARTLENFRPEQDAGCAICMLTVEKDSQPHPVIVLPCGHYFHKECVSRWLIVHQKCPLCNQRTAPARQIHDPALQ